MEATPLIGLFPHALHTTPDMRVRRKRYQRGMASKQETCRHYRAAISRAAARQALPVMPKTRFLLRAI